ncbi:MAG: tRNA (adenosine(37)-N6)-threonylcarbamoyltransferase complex ATPase subunit type 1 TsaE [Candidatus Portnoybacteria bacterium RBG_13_41_18]|uniref:tRNA threonylcarbamoyladenosine biosynthesis protein TsaE n=1 Tax=Candidatus Portnoybacteria bacterium RBG_13_41_18 TaxID=1801991 RepID=A0A1G2F4V9_9BACT|nr:MAG: tRNA (adenosine(37)-N6)-threonylcarbamoyltransferase complex ATPase subunit type 1 TsaE [Candidatus Portnoybacteria bacterium RBG_13_41_18]
MEKQIFLTKSAEETQKVAGQILKDVLSVKNRKNAAVLALEGELGAGKTTFVQGLAKAMGIKEKITSPTFVILKRFTIYDLRFKSEFENIFHIDCYRLDKPDELAELGFEEVLKDQKNLIVIEWADKVKSIIPKDAVWVKFEWVDENKRKIQIFNE